HPADGIDLMAGPWVVRERLATQADGRPLRLRTYFPAALDGEAGLAEAYLADSQRYIERYSAQIGAYPFTEFSVVASPLPTGFGMPTLTYIGEQVLRLPFIRASSLGHEVLHNWWGNGVLVDYARGNWSEGLTTFMADYAYKEAESSEAARAMRLEWLRDFSAVPTEQDTPLRTFTSRTHGTSQVVGYHKAAFMFFMLREEIGEPAFEQGLRAFWQAHRFSQAGWDDLRAAFENASGHALSGFFRQWLERNGAPRVRIERARQAGKTLHVTLVQEAPVYALAVPVRLESAAGAGQALLRMTETRQTFVLPAPSAVQAVVLDPDSRVFRLLPASELPPILRNIMLDPSTRLHVASEDPAFREAAQELAQAFLDHLPAGTDAPDGAGPLLIIAPNAVADTVLARLHLPPRPTGMPASGTAQVWATRATNGTTAVVITAHDDQAVSALQRGLPHYGGQSWLVFDGARVSARGIWPVQAQRVKVSR
ncbi:MAG: hypothetical protein KIS79_06410, partial [Burkholderiales bacterium]|nr:hypothetical protein [Burkholderiales bacterium]